MTLNLRKEVSIDEETQRLNREVSDAEKQADELFLKLQGGEASELWGREYVNLGGSPARTARVHYYGNDVSRIEIHEGEMILRKSWFTSGVPAEAEHYRGGKPDGRSYFWNKTGRLLGITSFRKGLKHGIYIRWMDDGRILGVARYDNGVVIEELVYPAGNTYYHAHMDQDGRIEGPFRRWSLDGEPLLDFSDVGYYIDGEIVL